jgi:hypothetical protein
MAYTKTEAPTFQKLKRATQHAETNARVIKALATAFATDNVKQGTHAEDKTGVDYWVHTNDNRAIGVDVKFRSTDRKRRGYDDLALETWSEIERSKIGWTRDANKMTDYVAWFWLDTGRYCILPFHLLRAVFTDKWEAWRQQYGYHHQVTSIPGQPRFTSECVFVPRTTVWRAIYEHCSWEGDSLTKMHGVVE